jgi:hypothetical protein
LLLCERSIAEKRLDGPSVSVHRHIGRRWTAPNALVTDLAERDRRIEPPATAGVAAWEWIGDGLGIFVTADDAESIKRTADRIPSACCVDVGQIRQIAIRNIR